MSRLAGYVALMAGGVVLVLAGSGLMAPATLWICASIVMILLGIYVVVGPLERR